MALQNPGQWFLSFDCATKSFAYCLMRISDPKRLAEDSLRKIRAATGGTQLEELKKFADGLKNCFYIAGGGAVGGRRHDL